MIPQYDICGVIHAYRMKANIDLFAQVGYTAGQEPSGEYFTLCGDHAN